MEEPRAWEACAGDRRNGPMPWHLAQLQRSGKLLGHCGGHCGGLGTSFSGIPVMTNPILVDSTGLSSEQSGFHVSKFWDHLPPG